MTERQRVGLDLRCAGFNVGDIAGFFQVSKQAASQLLRKARAKSGFYPYQRLKYTPRHGHVDLDSLAKI